MRSEMLVYERPGALNLPNLFLLYNKKTLSECQIHLHYRETEPANQYQHLAGHHFLEGTGIFLKDSHSIDEGTLHNIAP